VKPEPTAAPLDPRAQDFLRAGERALDEGDLEGAKENLDKASVVAEKDPRVLLDLARLATVRADVPWLRQRLLQQDPGDETKRSLGELSAKAKAAADAALAASPEDTAAVRVKMDALRIAGERDQARAFVTKIILNAQQPETAYVLAALDLAEPEPLWKTIIERLRLAAQAEGNAGRARAALVYALAKSGDPAAAKTELDRLGALARPHPLFQALKAFVEKAPQGKIDGGAPVAVASGAVDVNTLPKPSAGGSSGGGSSSGVGSSSGGGGDAPIAGDAKSLVSQANAAMGRRDYTRAEQLFSAALDKNPRDSEAQAGLGDVARAQHNLAGARASYEKAVAINGHYLPALIGLADTEWDMGDKASATKRYKDMLDNFPEGALPPHVKQRGEAPAPPPPPPPALTTNPMTNPTASPTTNNPSLQPTAPPDPAP
jgi:tetratricopeptide (TPR) repeat protein